MGKNRRRRGRRPRKKKVKKVLDAQKFHEYSNRTPTLIACRNCADYNLLSIINYGEDNLDAFARNNILVTCPICGYSDVAENINGERLWLPYDLEPVRKRLEAKCHVGRREPQSDDPIRLAKRYAR